MLLRSLAASSLMALLVSCAGSPPPPPPVVARPSAPPEPIVKAPAPPAERRFDIAISPHRNAGGAVADMAVTVHISGFPQDRPLELWMSEDLDGETGWPEGLGELTSHDASGPIHFQKRAAKDEDGDPSAAWLADRLADGPVEISYSVRVQSADGSHVNGVREHAGGVQGTGSAFFPNLKDDKEPYASRIHWDLAGLDEGAVALSTFGSGDCETHGSLERLGHGVFMAGKLGQLAVDRGTTHFHGAWLGSPAFDPEAAIRWAADVRDVQRTFFRDKDETLFTFFVRVVPKMGPTWLGTGRTDGFLLMVGDELKWTRKARFAVAHELIHHWIGGSDSGLRLDGPERSAYWFTEGFTVYYTSQVMLRSGLAPITDVADDLRERTQRFALSLVNGAPNDDIVKGFSTSVAFEKLPYDRGLLYAAEVDAQVRAHSSGKRSLDDLVFELLGRARTEVGQAKTTKLPANAFREVLGTELGPDAQARYDAVILRGEKPTPPSDAFGPCIKSFQKGLPRFELGFDDPPSFDHHKIESLRKGSAAERAGMREGDVMVRGRFAPGNPDYKASVTVKRNGKDVEITFFPRGDKKVDALYWDLDPKAVDGQCRKP